MKHEVGVSEDALSIPTLLLKQQIQAEEKCLVNVLGNYLNRAVSDDDFRDCIQISEEGNHNQYILAHKAVKLGLISKSFNGKTFTVTFNPEVTSF